MPWIVPSHSGESSRASPSDLRIGIHQGDIVRDGKDILGDGVNIAPHRTLRPIGGVAVSEKIQQDLISQPQYEVKLLGEFALDGVDQRVEVYTLKTGRKSWMKPKSSSPMTPYRRRPCCQRMRWKATNRTFRAARHCRRCFGRGIAGTRQ